jgi:hypothetical protein
VRRRLILDGTRFGRRIHIEAAAATLCARRARFPAGAQLRLRFAHVVLDDADFAAPSILAGVPAFADIKEASFARIWERLPPGPRVERWRPRLLSVRGADVAGLTVSDTDLRACRFAGAHNLDKLRIENAVLAHSPPGWRWTSRRTIAEEHAWRDRQQLGQTRAPGWYEQDSRAPEWLSAESPPAGQVAALYRALRKGREDNKDEPGAADFYYGEMEMRRHGKREEAREERRRKRRGPWLAASIERLVLGLYWLVSGYGLRSWRALTSLLLIVLAAAVVFARWGFAPPEGPTFRPVAVSREGALVHEQKAPEQTTGWRRLPDAVLFSAQATTALLRGPERRLTPVGDWLHLGLRLTGPVLLGLAVLGLRGRVKR